MVLRAIYFRGRWEKVDGDSSCNGGEVSSDANEDVVSGIGDGLNIGSEVVNMDADTEVEVEVEVEVDLDLDFIIGIDI